VVGTAQLVMVVSDLKVSSVAKQTEEKKTKKEKREGKDWPAGQSTCFILFDMFQSRRLHVPNSKNKRQKFLSGLLQQYVHYFSAHSQQQVR
jgi:hypothetical protein